ncbi:hypothetical protein [Bradyrhizobium sp. 27S5]|uniref:hypothetical protein n=1 Tax=Bradyrhizobium sp. 27S5 TaxID=3139728 RepID=UPI0030D0800A
MDIQDLVTPPPKGKVWLWVGITIVLAVVASALWDFLFKPLTLWTIDEIVVLTNLGSKSLTDSMYRDIAKPPYERASYLSLLLISGTTAGLFVGMVVRRRSGTLLKKPTGFLESASVVGIALAILLQSVRVGYIVKSNAYIEQLQRASAPYMTSDQRLVVSSKAALIESKSDYDALVKEMIDALAAHGLKAPTRDVFFD